MNMSYYWSHRAAPVSSATILSKIVEKVVVRHLLLPAILRRLLFDQFAFRPSRNTSCALAYLLPQITERLEHNTYMYMYGRCLFIDFSKALETVNHLVLLQKLKARNIPPNILNWIANFLSGRTQSAKLDEK